MRLRRCRVLTLSDGFHHVDQRQIDKPKAEAWSELFPSVRLCTSISRRLRWETLSQLTSGD